MSTPDLSAFNFSFDPTLDTWAVSDKPAELDSSEIFLPNVEGRTEFLAPDPDRVPVIENSVRTDDPTYAARPAEERTRELYHVANTYTEDALRRTEEAIQAALSEVQESRARFRATSQELMQEQRAQLNASASQPAKSGGEEGQR